MRARGLRREGAAVKISALVWLVCVVALVIAGAMAFSGNLFPAAITLVLVCVVLLAHRLR
ncbi:hypothetical protein Kisp01_45980 [Kineosporia sp. NBRC 101677]|nr:hypothetical protein Kisp01_45980 [Kineosporia sp. NBRC 101677]